MVGNGRQEIKDQRFDQDVSDQKFNNKLFVRIVAKGKTFENVDFMYSIFDAAYMRNCTFVECSFVGCRFVNCNFVGSSFNGCKFDYATFEKIQIDNDVLSLCCPGPENLKLKFARSLRINYQQLGDAKSANKAMNVELAATEEHHKKAWFSNESYYRQKYSGLRRIKAFTDWLDFKLLDFVWGNGENLFKFVRTVVLMLLIISLVDVLQSRDAGLLSSYWEAFNISPQILFGITKPLYLTEGWQVAIFFARLVMFAFFISIVIKRYNRR